jgi:hypothetical protein
MRRGTTHSILDGAPRGRRKANYVPAHPLIELIEKQEVAQGKRVDFTSIEVDLPMGRTTDGGDGRWPGGLAKVFEDPRRHGTHSEPAPYPTHRRAFWKRRNQGPSSYGHSRGSQEYCRRRKERSGWGIRIVTRPSALVRPVIPSGEPLGFWG